MDTFDIAEPQIIVHYPNDAQGFYWHMRILLRKIGGGRWVAATPDLELVVIDLTQLPHQVLDRNGRFPRAHRNEIYAFDDLTRAEINGLKRRAAVQASILDDAAAADVDEAIWVVSENSHPRFGETLSEDDLVDAPLGEEKGVVVLDNSEVFVQKILRSGLVDWRKERRTAEGDLRLLGDHRDASGRRYLPFKDAVPLLRETSFEDWKKHGPRATREWLGGVREGPGHLTTYHSEWLRRSGVSESTAVAHIHFILCEYFRLALEVDQLDVSNLQSSELLARRIIQDETAVARNPRHPDYGGLDIIMHAPTTEKGNVAVGVFTEWVTGRLKDQANIHKQTRLWNEEQRLRGDKGEGKGGKGDNERKTPADGKKKKKKRPEAAAEEGEG